MSASPNTLKKNNRKMKQALEEESSASESFQSVDTDPNQTNYNLEASNNLPSTSQAAMTRRSPAKVPKKTLPPAKQLQQQGGSSKGGAKPKKAPVARPPPPESSSSEEEEDQNDTQRSTRSQAAAQTPKRAAPARRRKQAVPVKLARGYTGQQIPMAPFGRLVKELMQKDSRSRDMRLTGDSLAALQAATEIYVTGVMGDAYQITMSRKQVTLLPRDINVLMFLRGPGSKLGCA